MNTDEEYDPLVIYNFKLGIPAPRPIGKRKRNKQRAKMAKASRRRNRRN